MTKHFRVVILLLIFVLVLLSSLLVYVIFTWQSFFLPSAIVIALILTALYLVRYVEKSNRDLTHFLLSIRQNQFMETYQAGNRGRVFEELSDAMNDIIREFSRLNLERELHYQLLIALNETISVGIMIFSQDEMLRSINPAAKKLLAAHFVRRSSDLQKIDADLYSTILRLGPDQRVVREVVIENERKQLGLQVKEMRLGDDSLKIVLIQNLKQELDWKEIDSWYQLVRVLTHEIMNSITPIASLADALSRITEKYKDPNKTFENISKEDTADLHDGLTTIAGRSKGLLKFVGSYKAFAKPLQINPEQADIVSITHRVLNLLRADFEQAKIKSTLTAEPTVIHSTFDVALIEQVIVNILKNAFDAVPHDGKGIIGISIKLENDEILLDVKDNGIGIGPEELSKVFIPFFTTKANGTGIGLSLCRKIMQLHHGNIDIHSTVNIGSTVSIRWKRNAALFS